MLETQGKAVTRNRSSAESFEIHEAKFDWTPLRIYGTES